MIYAKVLYNSWITRTFTDNNPSRTVARNRRWCLVHVQHKDLQLWRVDAADRNNAEKNFIDTMQKNMILHLHSLWFFFVRLPSIWPLNFVHYGRNLTMIKVKKIIKPMGREVFKLHRLLKVQPTCSRIYFIYRRTCIRSIRRIYDRKDKKTEVYDLKN
jgi:hypothetical protein